MSDFRLALNRETRLCISLSARPGDFGTRLHNFLYARLQLNYVYKAFATRDLPGAVAGMRALGIRGSAVSMPFKEAVMAHLDRIDPAAARIGAVNTIVNDEGTLVGLNTDYLAIRRLFADRAVPAEARIAVFGSGGMAKAIGAALADSGYRQIAIVARNEKTGRALAERHGGRWLPDWPAGVDFDVLVNASPVGMAPQADQCPCPEAVIASARYVVDAVSIPVRTRLIQAAERLGKNTVTGFEITVLQSLEQFKLYTGVTPDPAAVQAATTFALEAA